MGTQNQLPKFVDSCLYRLRSIFAILKKIVKMSFLAKDSQIQFARLYSLNI